MKKLIALLVTLFLLFSTVTPAAADDGLQVYYAGPDGSVKQALELAGFTLVSDPAQADVFVLNGEIPQPEAIAARVNEDAGLVLILGPEMTSAEVETLLGFPVSLERRDDPASLTGLTGVSDPLLSEIIWHSAPRGGLCSRLPIIPARPSRTPLSGISCWR